MSATPFRLYDSLDRVPPQVPPHYGAEPLTSPTISTDLLRPQAPIATAANPVERALPGETIFHAWTGVVGPRPSIISAVSCLLLASVFAHLILALPDWWPYAAGAVAGVVNLALALWQAGSHRVVAVTDSGIHVLRKARWSSKCTHRVGSMPRMPLGPVKGRWCKMSIANSVMWVHSREHATIERFDQEYRGWFQERMTSADISIPLRAQHR